MAKIYADGLWVQDPKKGRPEFILYEMAVNANKFIPFLEEHKNDQGYVNLDLLQSRDGTKVYFQLNKRD